MELFSREPTSSARIEIPPRAAPPGADTAWDVARQPYPSPLQERAPSRALKYTVADMAATSPNGAGPALNGLHSGSVSPRTVATPKTVQFVLVFQESPYRARLPLRVSIYPHDTTDSIITTVKNFYGLYSGPTVSKGVSFEDEQGNTLIARYENFRNNMTVYVRVIEELPPFGSHGYHPPPLNAQGYYNINGYAQAPQQTEHHTSRPTSRTSRLRSPSPNGGRGRRSTSVGANSAGGKKGRSRSSKNRSQTNGDGHSDSFNGYSSGDGAPGSSSGRAKEQLGNTDISVENIVEGGRRKRAKFESSELPLFAPPQMPAATSNPSVSPARRMDHHRNSLPFIHPGQNPFSNPAPLQSPQSYHNGYAHLGMHATPGGNSRRGRESCGYPSGQGIGPGMHMMLTPDPTVGSCMSEEDKDVAMQLMRLGEISTHGRASASTLDDTFSGRADAASSTGATSEADSCGEEDMPSTRRQKLDASGFHKKTFHITESHFVGPQDSAEVSCDDADRSDGENGAMAAPPTKPNKLKANTLTKVRPQPANKTKSSKPAKPKVKKAADAAGPLSPASIPASRKQSIVSNPTFPPTPGEEEQPDLSTKPRCQRCRKSKKGCDRQRPCGRCRDAGIPADQCISEDEGNGRKGRYGRHMGVPIKKEDMPPPPTTHLLPAAPIAVAATAAAGALPAAALNSALTMLDKNKKRKR
ncbi:hypothetical protein MMYC01_206879 [Madurella mycetomatis]|uniref:Zn(2)-C6 fungal-type domain-containing protein n=1 Tax=Madurella mycetomatis TaxID=100816 RepID=A0A175VZU4_9PEZI|nr:hypothetical protein MMYC01_206879 [Madurella mycetomatis]